MSKSIKLNVPNQEDLELPVLEASIGHDVVDIQEANAVFKAD